MNFLAHLALSPPGEDALLGSLMGDFVKGPLGERYPGAIGAAIALHRRIDSFTDAHPRVLGSRTRIGAPRRRYAGIMIDVFYDHFLARHWRDYRDEPLGDFTRRVYALLERRQAELPERLQAVAARMAARDWLGSYAEAKNVGRALEGIGTRLRRGNGLIGAGGDLERDYAGFEADFRAFFPDLLRFARDAGRAL